MRPNPSLQNRAATEKRKTVAVASRRRSGRRPGESSPDEQHPLLGLQTLLGNTRVASLIARRHDPVGPASRAAPGLERTAAPSQVIQRVELNPFVRHQGRPGMKTWTDLNDTTYVNLWAKDAARTHLWQPEIAEKLQEEPSSAQKLVDAVFPKLRRALEKSETEFTGSQAARDKAVAVLQIGWDSDKLDILDALIGWYGRKMSAAISVTPPGTELVTRPEEVQRVRHSPYDQTWWNGWENMRIGRKSGNREIVDIRGCESRANCGKDPWREIWFVLKGDGHWIYQSPSQYSDPYNWHVASVAGEVAENTKLAGELFPLLIKLAGFSLGLSSRLAIVFAASVLEALAEQGLRSQRGEKMQSAMEIMAGIGFDLFINGATNYMHGRRDVVLPPDLDRAAQKAGALGRREVVKTDAKVVMEEIQAGRARPLKEGEFAEAGYRTEVKITSEGQPHAWREARDGQWCRFSGDSVCDAATEFNAAMSFGDRVAAERMQAKLERLRQTDPAAAAKMEKAINRAPRAGEAGEAWLNRTNPNWRDAPGMVSHRLETAEHEMRVATLDLKVHDPGAVWEHYITRGGYDDIMRNERLLAGGGNDILGQGTGVRFTMPRQYKGAPNSTTFEFQLGDASTKLESHRHMAEPFAMAPAQAGDAVGIHILKVRYANGAVATRQSIMGMSFWRLEVPGGPGQTLRLDQLLARGETPTL